MHRAKPDLIAQAVASLPQASGINLYSGCRGTGIQLEPEKKTLLGKAAHQKACRREHRCSSSFALRSGYLAAWLLGA